MTECSALKKAQVLAMFDYFGTGMDFSTKKHCQTKKRKIVAFLQLRQLSGQKPVSVLKL
jgi:hypothetical protein